MKAAVYYGINDFRIEEQHVPEIGEDDLLLRVNACAICDTDIKVYTHGYKTMEPPQIIGHEISGTIGKKGKDVEGYEEGDRVCIAPIVSCGRCYYCQRGMTHMIVEAQRSNLLKIVVRPSK